MAIQIASKEKQLAYLEKEFKRLKGIDDQFEKDKKIRWTQMAEILCKIQDGQLYRPKYHTFEQYCLQELNIGRSYTHRLKRGYEAVKMLPNSEIVNISTESQARELAKVPETKRVQVLGDAKKKGRLTAKSIKEAASKLDAIEKDKTGYPIPTPAMAIWNRRDEVRDKLRPLQELRQWAEDMQGSDDPLFAEITFSTFKLDIEAVITTLKGAVPHAVCPVCQGQAPKTCAFCKGRGMVSKFLYHGIAVPEEMKAMREKLAASA
jgi:hypothetical protein